VRAAALEAQSCRFVYVCHYAFEPERLCFEPLQLSLNLTVFKEWQTPTISTGSIQNSGEKYIRLTKSSTSILLEPKLFRRDNNMSEISFSNRFYEEFDWNYADLDIIDRLQINIWIRRVFATISINLQPTLKGRQCTFYGP
jgi:hypothetical protein